MRRVCQSYLRSERCFGAAKLKVRTACGKQELQRRWRRHVSGVMSREMRRYGGWQQRCQHHRRTERSGNICHTVPFSTNAKGAESNPLGLCDPTLVPPGTAGFIDGVWVTSASTGRAYNIVDPATGEAIPGLIPLPALAHDEARSAIDAAAIALQSWSDPCNWAPSRRATILLKWHDLINEHLPDLAKILTIEMGKPVRESVAEWQYSMGFLSHFAHLASAGGASPLRGESMPRGTGMGDILCVREPVGVVASITPWNFPAAMLARKVGAAFAAGCTMVAKPSELTPLSALALCELGRRAGLPPGVFNIVSGDAGAIGAAFCDSHDVRKLTFTGSTRVGKLLYAACADTVKRVSMELGGNAPFIVFDDADLDAAVTGLIAAKLRNNGQTCVAANRIFVHEKVYDLFVSRLQAAVDPLVVGPGLRDTDDVHVHMGPLINEVAVAKVKEHLKDATEHGATALECSHQNIANESHSGGYFAKPYILTGVSADMRCFREETFGPLFSCVSFADDDEVLALANDTRAGLAAYIYTRDLSRVRHIPSKLQYGMVAVNAPSVSSPAAPFGGIKESGMGREGSHLGLDDYLQVKSIHVNS